MQLIATEDIPIIVDTDNYPPQQKFQKVLVKQILKNGSKLRGSFYYSMKTRRVQDFTLTLKLKAFL